MLFEFNKVGQKFVKFQICDLRFAFLIIEIVVMVNFFNERRYDFIGFRGIHKAGWAKDIVILDLST